MKTIPQSYTRGPFTYQLVLRDGQWAIYSQRHKGWDEPRRWELVKIRVQAARQTPHFAVEAAEILPGDNDWGRLGWTCWTLAEAKAMLAKFRGEHAERGRIAGRAA